MIALFRSTLFAFIFYPGTAVAVLTAFLTLPFGPMAVRRHALRWAFFHRLCAAWLLGVRSRVEGVIPEGPHLYAVKHQSMYETLELLLIVNDPAVVLKRELADIPLFGFIARAYGVIPVDRAGSATALRRMMRAAAAARDGGRPVLIFPEGTRVPPGEQPPLQPGFAGLYKQLRLPVVPCALDSGRLWPRRTYIKRPGIVTFRFGEALPPGLPRAEIEAKVHAAINVLDPGGDQRS